jgi:hypothetical protein
MARMTVKVRIVTLGVFLSSIAGAAVLISCGTDNVFEPLAKKDDKDKGKNALQDGNYDAAILSLEQHLADHPEDSEARAMLANAYMSKAGIDQIQLAAKIAGSEGGDWSSIVSAMPEGSQDNVDALSKAVETLSAIPAADRTPEQSYQLAMAQASLAVTITKKTAGDGQTITDGKVDACGQQNHRKCGSYFANKFGCAKVGWSVRQDSFRAWCYKRRKNAQFLKEEQLMALTCWQ